MVNPAGVWRAVARWYERGVPALVLLNTGLLLKFAVNAVQAQSAPCSSGMCERPLSTTSTLSTASEDCYLPNATLVVKCNAWFQLNAYNYTVKCVSGDVWIPDGGCRLDILIIIACASAALVAIFLLFVIILCVRRCTVKKRQRKHVTGALGMKKGQYRPKNNDKSPNGQTFAKGHTAHDAESIVSDDFTDDDEEAVVKPNRIIDSANERNVYQNQEYEGDES